VKYKNIFFVLIIIIFFIFLYFFLINNNFSKNLEINEIQSVKIAGKILKVELALTSEEQEKGLSERKKINEDEGMLFVFNYTGQYSFWMKDMNFPLDIIWIDDDFKVVYIEKNALPESYPATFSPKVEAKYILEVLSQFSQKNNLKVGDKVEFLSS